MKLKILTQIYVTCFNLGGGETRMDVIFIHFVYSISIYRNQSLVFSYKPVGRFSKLQCCLLHTLYFYILSLYQYSVTIMRRLQIWKWRAIITLIIVTFSQALKQGTFEENFKIIHLLKLILRQVFTYFFDSYDHYTHKINNII